MAYPNGRWPASALAPVPGSPGEYLARGGPVESFTAMRAAAARDGVVLKLADGYRPISRQYYWRSYWCGQGMCYRAAVPGTSNHGLAKAGDFVLGPGVFNWLSQHAWKYGWSHAEGARVGEAWHWTYEGGFHPAPARAPLWFLTSQERRLVREYRDLKKRGVNPKRRGQLYRWFIDNRKNIYRAAKKSGWNKLNRKRRYEFFRDLTR
jgi:hypothetical protein